MRRFFFGNFDFEHQLAGPTDGAPGSTVASLNLSLASCWLGLAEAGDLIYLPGEISGNFRERLQYSGFPDVSFTRHWPDSWEARSLEFVPWGWSSTVSQLAHAQGFLTDSPDLGAVRAVNARAFSFQLESAWDLALPGSCQPENLPELEQALPVLCHDETQEWVLKANFSMSARERIQGRGTELNDSIRGWATRRFAQGQPLFLEPWIAGNAEAGIQFEIPSEGEPAFLGLAVLLNDARGQYRGSRINVDEATHKEWQPAIEVAQRVAQKIQRAGYTGPLGIDAMQFRDRQGHLQFRAIQDINARYTMGRLALGFQRFLKAGEVASWLHFPWKESYGIDFSNWLRCLSQAESSGIHMLTTSPDRIDGQPLRLVNMLLIAENMETLKTAETALVQAHAELNESDG